MAITAGELDKLAANMPAKPAKSHKKKSGAKKPTGRPAGRPVQPKIEVKAAVPQPPKEVTQPVVVSASLQSDAAAAGEAKTPAAPPVAAAAKPKTYRAARAFRHPISDCLVSFKVGQLITDPGVLSILLKDGAPITESNDRQVQCPCPCGNWFYPPKEE